MFYHNLKTWKNKEPSDGKALNRGVRPGRRNSVSWISSRVLWFCSQIGSSDTEVFQAVPAHRDSLICHISEVHVELISARYVVPAGDKQLVLSCKQPTRFLDTASEPRAQIVTVKRFSPSRKSDFCFQKRLLDRCS